MYLHKHYRLDIFHVETCTRNSKKKQTSLTCGDADRLSRCDNKSVGATKITIEKITKIMDVVVGREYACVQLVGLHMKSYHI